MRDNKNSEQNFIFSNNKDIDNKNNYNNINNEENSDFKNNYYHDQFYMNQKFDENTSYSNNNSQLSIRKETHNKRKSFYLILLIIILLAGFLFIQNRKINIFDNNQNNSNTTDKGLVTSPTPDSSTAPPASGSILTGAQIAEKIKPSAVAIVVYSDKPSNNQANNLNGKILPSGYGSGVIMTSDGYVITNAHVVSNSKSVAVVLSDKTEYEAKIVGVDTKTDLAVLKIDANNLKAAEFGDSSKLKEGEDVYAIGNPSGIQLSGSFTKGIISGLNRRIQSYGGATVNAIQTDAAINPGNSGGALVNSYGQVIGINSSKISSVSYEGIGFSIPINEAKPIIDSILKHGYVKDRVKLGISLINIDEISAALNFIKPGVYISQIDQKTNIYKAGARQGDSIINFAGKAINNSNELLNELLTKKPGEEVTMTLFRPNTNSAGGKNVEIKFILEEDDSKKSDSVQE